MDGGCTDGCLGIIRMGGGGIKNTIKTERDDPTILIANAMSNLTLQEREQAYEDLHGEAAIVHETPELIAETLSKMEHCPFEKRMFRIPSYDSCFYVWNDSMLIRLQSDS
jgi:hypothetical protein